MGEGSDCRRLRVTLVKSAIGYAKDQRLTVEALGLSKVGQTRVMNDSPAVRGMITKVSHLLSVEEA
jgi:large subunit ribosomal protein L30